MVVVKHCKTCGKEFKSNIETSKYCCVKCAANDRNDQQEKIRRWLAGDTQAVEIINGLTSGELRAGIKAAVKKHLLEEQKHSCAICGCSELWNNKFLVFIIDHIDGNSHNNTRDNLRLLCPNCDSQLDTYKSKNIGKGRTSARQFYAEAHHKENMED